LRSLAGTGSTLTGSLGSRLNELRPIDGDDEGGVLTLCE
jgi:hypothetical protein